MIAVLQLVSVLEYLEPGDFVLITTESQGSFVFFYVTPAIRQLSCGSQENSQTLPVASLGRAKP